MRRTLKEQLRNFKNARFFIKKRALSKLKKGMQLHTGARCSCGTWAPFVWDKKMGFGVQRACSHGKELEVTFKQLDLKTLDTYIENAHYQKRWGLLVP